MIIIFLHIYWFISIQRQKSIVGVSLRFRNRLTIFGQNNEMNNSPNIGLNRFQIFAITVHFFPINWSRETFFSIISFRPKKGKQSIGSSFFLFLPPFFSVHSALSNNYLNILQTDSVLSFCLLFLGQVFLCGIFWPIHLATEFNQIAATNGLMMAFSGLRFWPK